MSLSLESFSVFPACFSHWSLGKDDSAVHWVLLLLLFVVTQHPGMAREQQIEIKKYILDWQEVQAGRCAGQKYVQTPPALPPASDSGLGTTVKGLNGRPRLEVASHDWTSDGCSAQANAPCFRQDQYCQRPDEPAESCA